MNNRLVILVSGAILALGACSKHDTAGNSATDLNASADNGVVANASAAAPAALPTTAQAFVNAAAASDRFEVESSKMAASSAKSAAIKRFAQQMVTAHTASTAKLKSTVAGLNPAITPDDTPSTDQQSKLDQLKGLKGADFDTAFASAQVDGHQATLDMLKNYAASGDNATLKAFANGMIPTVTAHLNLAKGLK